jgi:PAS domain S-box-containing protein
MKLKTQIFLGFLFILILTLFLSSVFVFYLENLGKASEKVLKENYRSVKASEELVLSLAKMDQILAKICLGSNYNQEILMGILENEKKIFRNNLSISRKNISEIGEKTVVQNLHEGFDQYVESIKTFETSTDKVALYFNVLQRQNEIIRETCVNLIELNHKALSRKDILAQKLYFRAKVYIFVITILVLIISGISIYKIPQLIVRPIIDITDKIKRIAEGEYEHKIAVNSHNELGELIEAFNVMSVKLKEFEESNYAEIKAQKSRIETIIKSLNDGLIILNEKKEVIIANEAASTILNVSEDDLLGRKASDIAAENSVMNDLLASINNKDQNQEEKANSKNFIKVINEEDKQEFFAKEIVTVYDSKNTSIRKFLGHIIMLKDVTSFKKSDEAKTNFIAVVSHELKTPLSAMNMSLMLLQDERFGSLNDEQTQLAASMKKEVQRLIKMVTELLDLSKVETGTIDLEKKFVSPELLIEYSTAPVEIQLKEKDIVIVRNVNKDLPEVFVDPEKISWVLINFLSNAVRYSPPGGKITVTVMVNDSFMEFAVHDEGPGIEPENLSKVFNKFVQIATNGKKNKSGLGLGLAISKEVIDAHDGEIAVASEFGEGSKFYFRIPINVLHTENMI